MGENREKKCSLIERDYYSSQNVIAILCRVIARNTSFPAVGDERMDGPRPVTILHSSDYTRRERTILDTCCGNNSRRGKGQEYVVADL